MDNSVPASPVKKNNFFKILLVIFLILGFASSFLAGIVLDKYLLTEVPGKIVPTPIPVDKRPDSSNQPDQPPFLPGNAYFEDTIIAIVKDNPHQTIAATVSRIEQKEQDFTQYSRLSYFNGESWNRKSAQKQSNSATIISSDIVKNWQMEVNPSRVLREKVTGKLQFDKTSIEFDTGEIKNEIGMRSLPGYTKFMSKGSGTLKIDGNSYPAYILYTQIYSLNSSEIQFYDTPFDLTTYWLIFWDQNGNFYHVDSTNVPNPSQIYQTHQIGVKETPEGGVFKTFQVTSTSNNATPPSQYTFNLSSPVSESINVNLLNSINKAPNNSYKWYMGQVEGQINGVQGFGLVEYIHN